MTAVCLHHKSLHVATERLNSELKEKVSIFLSKSVQYLIDDSKKIKYIHHSPSRKSTLFFLQLGEIERSTLIYSFVVCFFIVLVVQIRDLN